MRADDKGYKDSGRMMAGQDLVAAGYAGLAGIRILVKARREELEKRFAADYLEDLIAEDGGSVLLQNAKYRMSLRVAECEPAGEGGILSAVWSLTGACRLGVEFSLRRIPVRQGVIEISELWGINPYRLYSGGCWLMASDNGGRLVHDLREQGIAAAVIGGITTGIARVITDGGERSYLNRPQPDELERVFPDWKRESALNALAENGGSDVIENG